MGEATQAHRQSARQERSPRKGKHEDGVREQAGEQLADLLRPRSFRAGATAQPSVLPSPPGASRVTCGGGGAGTTGHRAPPSRRARVWSAASTTTRRGPRGLRGHPLPSQGPQPEAPLCPACPPRPGAGHPPSPRGNHGPSHHGQGYTYAGARGKLRMPAGVGGTHSLSLVSKETARGVRIEAEGGERLPAGRRAEADTPLPAPTPAPSAREAPVDRETDLRAGSACTSFPGPKPGDVATRCAEQG